MRVLLTNLRASPSKKKLAATKAVNAPDTRLHSFIVYSPFLPLFNRYFLDHQYKLTYLVLLWVLAMKKKSLSLSS